MTVNTKITKDHAYRMTLSGFTSGVAVLGILWVFAEPVIVKSVSVAMADDINEAVQQQVAPINTAFTVILQNDINNIKREIAALEFRQRRNEDWTSEDAQTLANRKIELKAFEDAVEALEENM